MNRDEVIALARKLYADGKGMSYNAIAMKFNTDGVPTVSGSGKWEHKMIKRLVSADTLQKAEVKVGLKSERESQLESEVESLKLKLRNIESYRDELFSANNRLESELNTVKQETESLRAEIAMIETSENKSIVLLESENAGLRQDRDEALKELNRVKQHLSERTNQINTVYAVNAKLTLKSDRLISGIKRLYSRKSQSVNGFRAEAKRLRADNESLQMKYISDVSVLEKHRDDFKTQRDCFKAESERLNRQLVESESKYKTLYESEITRLGNELAIAKQRIQELQDRQTFLKPESESGVPKNFNGWTIGKRSDGRGYNIYRKIAGKTKGLYIGKEWDESDARNKITAFEAKQKPQSELFGTDCKSCQHQPEFESRLRAVCPEMVRTYRLDTVAKSFHDYDFSREMIALAEQKRIELLAGDASQCDVSKLVQYRGRMYVNFEWR